MLRPELCYNCSTPCKLVAWTAILSGDPNRTTSTQVEIAIISPKGKLEYATSRRLPSFRVSATEVSVGVGSLLEEHGRLENFYLAPMSDGKHLLLHEVPTMLNKSGVLIAIRDRSNN